MFQDPSVLLLVNTLPNKAALVRPMSKDARLLLTTMINWSRLWPHILPKFAAQYDPIPYEEACHRYNMFKYKDVLKGCKPKTDDEVLSFMRLDNLKDRVWSSKLEDNKHKIGLISNYRSAEVYRWLTTNFLMTDFNGNDLNKISYLGDEKFSLDVIKSEASRVGDPDKRNVSYLYAIVVDVTERQRIVTTKAVEQEKQYSDRLTQLIMTATEPKTPHKFDGDELERWENERKYIDLLEGDDG